LTRDEKRTAVEVALSTTAVPLLLPAYRVDDVELLDGGMWASNPIAFAMVEAVNLKWWPGKDVRVLSLGCTTSPIEVKWNTGKIGQFRQRQNLMDAFLAIQSAAAMTMARNLLDNDERIIRIDRMLDKPCGLGDASQIDNLRDLGMAEAKQKLMELKERFFSGGQRREFTPFSGREKG
jgi:hypothetical protein